jgi:uncharacterized protein (TIGR03437 family)
MLRGIAVLVALTAASMSGANVQLLATLPNAAVPAAMQLDSAGNIYVAGTFVPTGKNGTSAFVAKLAPGGSPILYFTAVGGSFNDTATVLVLGSDGSAYFAGNTNSTDFPVTAGALRSTSNGGAQGFLAKVDPSGAVVYSSYIGGSSATQITGIARDRAGDIFLTGTGGPAFPSSGSLPARGFVLEVDPGLTKTLLSTYGYGGGPIALDSQGNIYLAGSAQPIVTFTPAEILTLPQLPGSPFQATHQARFCLTLGSGPGGGGGQLPCQYQYVAKLDPTGTLLWATYVTGTYGAIAGGMAVDGAGNVIVAGTTNSDDYPVTPGAFQTAYAAAAPPFPQPAGSTFSQPPPASGYVTKINANGTSLIWSTYFGGSFADEITGMAVAPSGEIFVSGYADSNDLPALAGTPQACHPSANQVLGFVTRLAPDGTTAGPTQLVRGAPECLYFSCGSLLYNDYPNYPALGPIVIGSNGAVMFAGANGTLESVDFSAGSRLSCVVDPADSVQVSTVAPGQLLSLFGTDLAPATPFLPPAGVAASSSSFGVFFNGFPAPILYSAAQQINVQVPYEIAGQSTVQMQLIDRMTPLPVSETLTLGVVDRQPAVFLTPAATASLYPGYTVCGGAMVFGPAAVALNADGTLNDCGNPALAGTAVTVFVDGLGQVTPALATGAIATAPPVALTPAVVARDSRLGPITSTTMSLPGAIDGVAQLRLQLPQGLPLGPYAISPTVDGKPLRERLVVVWIRPN